MTILSKSAQFRLFVPHDRGAPEIRCSDRLSFNIGKRMSVPGNLIISWLTFIRSRHKINYIPVYHSFWQSLPHKPISVIHLSQPPNSNGRSSRGPNAHFTLSASWYTPPLSYTKQSPFQPTQSLETNYHHNVKPIRRYHSPVQPFPNKLPPHRTPSGPIISSRIRRCTRVSQPLHSLSYKYYTHLSQIDHGVLWFVGCYQNAYKDVCSSSEEHFECSHAPLTYAFACIVRWTPRAGCLYHFDHQGDCGARYCSWCVCWHYERIWWR